MSKSKPAPLNQVKIFSGSDHEALARELGALIGKPNVSIQGILQSESSAYSSIETRVVCSVTVTVVYREYEVLAEENRTSPIGNYVANRVVNPTEMKFDNGRRVFLTVDGFLDTDFEEMSPVASEENPTAELERKLSAAETVVLPRDEAVEVVPAGVIAANIEAEEEHPDISGIVGSLPENP